MADTVKMLAKDGSEVADVPVSEVEHYKSLGAKVVPQEPFGRSLMRGLVKNLPGYGGLAGGIIGGGGGSLLAPGGGTVAGAMGGAALGGAAGEVARQRIASALKLEPDMPPMEAAAAIPLAAAGQATQEGIGLGLVGGLSRMAPPLMRSALRPSKAAQRAAGTGQTQTARAMYPEQEELWLDFLRERIGVNKGGKARLAGLKEGAVTQKQAALAGAGKQKFTVFDVIGEDVARLRKQADRASFPVQAHEALSNKLKAFIAEHKVAGGRLRRYSATELDALKQAWQDEAKSVYDAIKRGGATTANERASAQFSRAIAGGARKALEGAAPGLASANARIQRFGHMESALSDALRSGSGARVSWGGPMHAVPMFTPGRSLASRLALTASNEGVQAGARQVPRALGFGYGMATQPELTPEEAQALWEYVNSR